MRLARLGSMQRRLTQINVPPHSVSFVQLQPISPFVQVAQAVAPESSILHLFPVSQLPLPKQGHPCLPRHPAHRLFSQAIPLLQVWSVLQAHPAVPSGQVRQRPSSQRKPLLQSEAPMQRQPALPGVHRSVGPASWLAVVSAEGISGVGSGEDPLQRPSWQKRLLSQGVFSLQAQPSFPQGGGVHPMWMVIPKKRRAQEKINLIAVFR